MADQSIRVTNLDNSDYRVAYDLWNSLRGHLPQSEGKAAIEQGLMLYVACRRAVRNGEASIADLR